MKDGTRQDKTRQQFRLNYDSPSERKSCQHRYQIQLLVEKGLMIQQQMSQAFLDDLVGPYYACCSS
jgi:hypothetical protein